jgi:hypothetical protein
MSVRRSDLAANPRRPEAVKESVKIRIPGRQGMNDLSGS